MLGPKIIWRQQMQDTVSLLLSWWQATRDNELIALLGAARALSIRVPFCSTHRYRFLPDYFILDASLTNHRLLWIRFGGVSARPRNHTLQYTRE